jgi:ubiquinone/menaquinone biosynthesis C-methylase UbiE
VDSRKNFFDDHAASWDEHHHRGMEAELGSLVRSFGLSEGDSVLDVGTGAGVLLPFLQEAVGPGGRVAAMDFAFRMLEEAKRRSVSHVKSLVNASVEAIPFGASVFDQITCFSSFPHFPNKDRALIEMVRVLKPGGSLSIAHLKSSEELRHLHQEVGGAVAHDELPGPEVLRDLMGRAGFKEVSIINQPGKFLARGRKE